MKAFETTRKNVENLKNSEIKSLLRSHLKTVDIEQDMLKCMISFADFYDIYKVFTTFLKPSGCFPSLSRGEFDAKVHLSGGFYGDIDGTSSKKLEK